MMKDISGNEEINETSESENEVEESEDSEEYEETHESTGDPYYAPDYSNYFENIQSIGIVLVSVLIGCMIALCFIQGFKKNE